MQYFYGVRGKGRGKGVKCVECGEVQRKEKKWLSYLAPDERGLLGTINFDCCNKFSSVIIIRTLEKLRSKWLSWIQVCTNYLHCRSERIVFWWLNTNTKLLCFSKMQFCFVQECMWQFSTFSFSLLFSLTNGNRGSTNGTNGTNGNQGSTFNKWAL